MIHEPSSTLLAQRPKTTARRRRLSVLVATAAAALTLAACGSAPASGPSETPSATPTAEAVELDGPITVFAAASLTATFTELAEQFEAEHPGVTVTLNFGGSSGLVTQLAEGADADVFASADERNMTSAQEQNLVTVDPVLFATNTLEIAVPPDNPAGIKVLEDLVEPGLRLVVCAPQVPCGAATQTVASSAGLTLSPVSEENAVTDVLGKVVSGEADAGLVYRTDVAGAGDTVKGIAFPEAALAVNSYPIALLAGSQHPLTAQAFIDFVTGPVGLAVLAAAGFGAP